MGATPFLASKFYQKEMMMSEEVYLRLRDFLDRMPGGFPRTPEGVELKLLKKLFLPEEAELAMSLTYLPEPASSIATRLGLEEAVVSARLEEMAKKGLIYRLRVGGTPFYMALQFVIGIYEFNLNRIDRELSELMEEYLPYLKQVWFTTKTKQLRVAPAGGALNAAPRVETFDRMRELIAGYNRFSISPCICRKEQALLGHPCSRPLETCLQFGNAADYYIENGLGREATRDEIFSVLELADKHALVLSPTNAQDVLSICCCCECCCGILRGLASDPRPADHVHSSFQARIDPEKCEKCGACLDRCQISALVETEESMKVDLARCIGCGLCVSACEPKAISLVTKPQVQPPPKTITDMSIKIMRERGLI